MGAVVVGDRYRPPSSITRLFKNNFRRLLNHRARFLEWIFIFLQSIGMAIQQQSQAVELWGRCQEYKQGTGQIHSGSDNSDRLIGIIIMGGSFGCSGHDMEKLNIAGEAREGSK